MIINRHPLTEDNDINYLKDNNGILFDIETTGFSPKSAIVYLIGMIYYDSEEKTLILEQWFVEKNSDEYELLYRFSNFIETFDLIYHYNGDQFDLPFLTKRMSHYKITMPKVNSIDFIKAIRPFKKTLKLPNLKLKTIEAYFSYEREDPFTGGDLIKTYHSYKDNADERLLKVLLLHNHEDLLGLKKIIDQSPFLNFLNDIKNGNLDIQLEVSSIENGFYMASFAVPCDMDLSIEHELFITTVSDKILTLKMPTQAETLKLYFDTPTDYYYLPAEDYAIHKSIGKYVHKDHRIKATKENCYIKKEDFFLPAYKHFQLPLHLYYREHTDSVGYVSVSELVEANCFELYLSKLLQLAIL